MSRENSAPPSTSAQEHLAPESGRVNLETPQLKVERGQERAKAFLTKTNQLLTNGAMEFAREHHLAEDADTPKDENQTAEYNRNWNLFSALRKAADSSGDQVVNLEDKMAGLAVLQIRLEAKMTQAHEARDANQVKEIQVKIAEMSKTITTLEKTVALAAKIKTNRMLEQAGLEVPKGPDQTPESTAASTEIRDAHRKDRRARQIQLTADKLDAEGMTPEKAKAAIKDFQDRSPVPLDELMSVQVKNITTLETQESQDVPKSRERCTLLLTELKRLSANLPKDAPVPPEVQELRLQFVKAKLEHLALIRDLGLEKTRSQIGTLEDYLAANDGTAPGGNVENLLIARANEKRADLPPDRDVIVANILTTTPEAKFLSVGELSRHTLEAEKQLRDHPEWLKKAGTTVLEILLAMIMSTLQGGLDTITSQIGAGKRSG